MDMEIRSIEELSINAHPSFAAMCYDGWLLRFAGGYTNRANSVNVLYPSVLPINHKIGYCENVYAKQNLPAIFKITPLSLDLDDALEKLHYSIVTPTNIMTTTIPQIAANNLISTVNVGISEHWQQNYFRLNQTSNAVIPLARKIQGHIIGQTLCAELACRNEIVACGLCVVEREYAGLYDIIVAPQHRQKGYGQDICASLLSKASLYGAKTAYLQVVADNFNAEKLYEKIGFKKTYPYWYRVKKT